jgi:hypothetical protein
MKSNLMIFLFLIHFTVEAREVIAKVVKLKGVVTQLRPGSMQASQVVLGDGLVEETSLLTQERSFARVEFKDGTKLNLGPKSKIVIENSKENEPTVVDLLKGKIRSKVEKDSASGTHKFFIKTRTAAMGVRGTDFHSTYNPENNITNVITYSGEVAIAKVNEKDLDDAKEKVEQKQISEARKGDYEVQNVSAEKKIDPVKKLDKVLVSNISVVVKQGQYSGVSLKLNKATEAVKINPIQYTALYKNVDLEEKSEREIRLDTKEELAERKVIAKEAEQVKFAEQSAPIEGFFDADKKEMAAKAGGFIDLETGLYIPPRAGSELDNKNQVYKTAGIGTIDAQTGQYVPPKGLELDPKIGFVVSEVTEEKKQEELIAKASELNSNTRTSIMITTQREAEKLSQDLEIEAPPTVLLSEKEQLQKDQVSLRVGSGDQSVDYMDSTRGSSERLNYTGNSQIEVEWRQAAIQKFQPSLGFAYKRARAAGDESNLAFKNLNSKSTNTFNLSFGYRFILKNRLNLYNALAFDQERFFASTASETNEVKVTTTKFMLGLEWMMLQSSKTSTWVKLIPHYNFSKKAGNFTAESGYGFHLGLDFWYWLKDTWRLEAGLFLKRDYQDVSHNAFEASSERSINGFSIGFGKLF